MFKIEAKKRTLKILKRLDKERKNKIKDVIASLKNDPVPFFLKKIRYCQVKRLRE